VLDVASLLRKYSGVHEAWVTETLQIDRAFLNHLQYLGRIPDRPCRTLMLFGAVSGPAMSLGYSARAHPPVVILSFAIVTTEPPRRYSQPNSFGP
jgi:hypothetical protein